jgi:hypothetical protein
MKKWNKLVTLGCSLSPLEGFWPEYLAEYLDIHPDNHAHYGFGGSGNQLLLNLWHEYFLKNDLQDTLVVWQITGLNRHSGLFKLTENEQAALDPKTQWNNDNNGCWVKINTFFDNKPRIGLYGNFSKFEPFNQYNIDAQTLYAQLTSTLCTIPCDTLIFRGWSGAVLEPKWQQSLPVFKKYQKTVIKEPYVDWVIENDFTMQDDGIHPTGKSSREYFNQIIKLYLDKI